MQTYFDRFRSNLELNDSFERMVSTRHTAVRSAIENIGAQIKESKLIGSLQRRTRIQPRPQDSFDIDILIVLGQFDYWLPTGGTTSGQALDYLLESVQQSDRYSAKSPTIDAPTISLDFADGSRVELVPAYIDNIGSYASGVSTLPVGRGYWIPQAGGGWQHADYDYDAEFITKMNAVSAGRLIPGIKMLKAARRTHFTGLKSFALEVLAAHALPAAIGVSAQHQSAALTDTQLIRAFFAVAKDIIGGPISIPGSNSPRIDLAPADQLVLKSAFEAILVHIDATQRLTSQQQAADAWRLLFGESFPARL